MNDNVDPKKLSPEITFPALGCSIQFSIGQDLNLVFQTHLPLGYEPAEINAALDKIMVAAQRQKARVNLPQAYAKLEKMQKMLGRFTEDIARLDSENKLIDGEAERLHRVSGRKGDTPRMTPALNAQRNKVNAERENAYTSINRLKQDIKLAEDEVAELEKLDGG